MLSSSSLLARGLKRSLVSAKQGARSAQLLASSRPALALAPQQQQQRRALSWDTNNPENLFKLTSQALIHDISLHQMETVKTVVPWFLTNMPVSAYVLRLFL